jgi:hypothetical protein
MTDPYRIQGQQEKYVDLVKPETIKSIYRDGLLILNAILVCMYGSLFVANLIAAKYWFAGFNFFCIICWAGCVWFRVKTLKIQADTAKIITDYKKMPSSTEKI